ncbi:MAG: thioredoxin family protein [Bdellovibrionales bacterium]|nr:thioredoxin family protein [Ramlibacter sp.]
MPELTDTQRQAGSVTLVVCLCAQWCGVCRDYRETFTQAAARFAPTQFIWVDIEDEADIVDSLDINDFPTLLVAVNYQPVFYGPLTPRPETLDRLLRSCMDRPPPALHDAALQDTLHALVKQLAARKP